MHTYQTIVSELKKHALGRELKIRECHAIANGFTNTRSAFSFCQIYFLRNIGVPESDRN